MNGKSRGAPRRERGRTGLKKFVAAFTQGRSDRRDWSVYLNQRGLKRFGTAYVDCGSDRMFWFTVRHPGRRAAQVVLERPVTSGYIFFVAIFIAGLVVR